MRHRKWISIFLGAIIAGFLVLFNAISAAERTPVAAFSGVSPGAGPGAGAFVPFKVYTDAGARDNHYVPSGWMGDWGDLKFSAGHSSRPHSGTTAIRVEYLPLRSQGANWAGMYWQNPANNWGSRPGGFDLTGARRLVFWARGEKGGETIEEFRIGGISGAYADSDAAGIGPVKLTSEWARYEIDLAEKDLSAISGGFMWSANLDSNPDGFTIYLDNIAYE